jgi:hypothetical protein
MKTDNILKVGFVILLSYIFLISNSVFCKVTSEVEPLSEIQKLVKYVGDSNNHIFNLDVGLVFLVSFKLLD